MKFYHVTGIRILAVVSLFCILTAAPGRADFIITGSSEDVAAGSTATLTFSISDTPLSQEQLAAFQLQLQITRLGDSSGELQFSPVDFTSNPPVYMQVDPYNYPNYVFSGDSFDQNFPPFWNNTSSTVPGGPLDLAIGGDSTADGSGISFSANSSYLLATVEIDATNAVVGDTYQIALVPDNTYFQDANGNNIKYSSGAAGITIVVEPAVSVVPAPSSLALAAIGCLTILLYYRWRTRSEVLSRFYGDM